MIETERTDGIVTLRMAHGKANAMDLELLHALRAELKAAANADALIITGAGSIFSAGVDLKRVLEGGADYTRQFVPELSAFMCDLFAFPGPLVVAANGHAIAGGALVVMAADYRIMAEGKGRFGVPELLVGVPFPAAALEVVRFAVRPDQLQSLVYTGKTVLPQEALAAGFVDEVVEPDALMNRAREVATAFAHIPGENFRATKYALRAPTFERIAAEGKRCDADTLRVWTAPGTHQVIRSYLESLPRKSL